MLDTYHMNISLTASACFSPAFLVDNTSAIPLLTLAVLHMHVFFFFDSYTESSFSAMQIF